MGSIKEIVELVFARWATHVAPAWGEGLDTPTDDQFAAMVEEAVSAALMDIPLQRCTPSVDVVAQVKAEALREAAESIVLREHHVGCPSCRVNAEAEAEVWLRDRATAIENGSGAGPDIGSSAKSSQSQQCAQLHPTPAEEIWIMPSDEIVIAFIANFKDPTWAMLAVARHVGIAVAYQDRGTFEAYLERTMTEDEWSRLKPLLEGYDEWLDNSGADESISFWRDTVLAEAAIEQDI